MTGALLYLRVHTLGNRARAQLFRLRRPKYLAGAVFVAAYFWFFFFRHASAPGRAMGGAGFISILSSDTTALMLGLGALGLSLALALMWLLPGGSAGIRFTEPEIAFLFPAPFTRRALIHYKVLDGQLSALLQSCFFALLFSHRHLFAGEAVATILSWWAVLACVNLHHLGSSLTLARLAARGVGAGRRRLVLSAALAILFGAAAAGVWRQLPALAASDSAAEWLAAVLGSPVLSLLLWPAKLMLAPFFAHGAGGFLLALAPALAVLAAQYFWVVRTEVAFEEASIAEAERRATRLAELRRTGTLRVGDTPRRGRRAPFDVARARWPELAFLWKNLLSTTRGLFTARTWAIAAAALVALSAALQWRMGASYWMAGGVLAGLGTMAAALTLLYGPLIARFDLRQDLVNTDLLRTYPLPGWRIVLGELLAPAAVLTGIIWLGLLAWYLGLHGHQPPALPPAWFNPGMRLVLGAAAAALAPFVVLLQLLVPNGAAILFPGMFRATHTPGAGLDLMGQRMLFGFGQVFALLLAFVPAAGLAFASYFITRGAGSLLVWLGWIDDPDPSRATAVLVMTVVAALVLTGEIACGVWWFGRRFARTDLVGETHA